MLESMSRTSRLERLADIQEMRDALTRYCDGIARCDFELAASAFHKDATEDHAWFIGSSHELLAKVLPILRAQYEALYRYVTNFAVTFTAEHAAESEAYWCMILRDSVLDLFQCGRYLDRWERRDGEWKIAARVYAVDWQRQDSRNRFKFPHDEQVVMKYTKRGLKDPEIRTILGLNLPTRPVMANPPRLP